MRVYITTGSDVALELLQRGWRDLHHDLGQVGLWCDERPPAGFRPAPGRGIMTAGPLGDTVLCAEVPEDVFRELEVQESTRSLTPAESALVHEGGPKPQDLEYQRMGYAVVPATVLARYGPPRLYDRAYATTSRAELLGAIRRWEQDEHKSGRRHAEEMRRAVSFFDLVGWRTALRLREEPEEG